MILHTSPVFIPEQQTAQLSAGYVSALIKDTNADRRNNNLPPLSVNPQLSEAAKEKLNDMSINGYFAHNSPSGLTPWYWISKTGYKYLYAGENLATDFDPSNSIDIERAWMNSPEHRANILNNNYTDIGMAAGKTIYNGKEVAFVVVEFGSSQSNQSRTIANRPVTIPPSSKSKVLTTAASRPTKSVALIQTQEASPKVLSAEIVATLENVSTPPKKLTLGDHILQGLQDFILFLKSL